MTAKKGSCVFVDELDAWAIHASAGVDYCGPRYIGTPDQTPNIAETYSWELISGPGSFAGATNLPIVPVTSSATASVYKLTVSFTSPSGVMASCTDEVIVPPCGCVVNIEVEAPFGCPSFDLNGGGVTLKASGFIGFDPAAFDFFWAVQSGPPGGLSSFTGSEVQLTDNIQRTFRVTMSSPLDPTFTCFLDTLVNNPAWSLPVFMAQDGSTCTNPLQSIDIGQPPVAGYSYAWTGPNGYTNAGSNPNVLPTEGGDNEYPVLVTDVGSGCTSRDTAVVTVRDPNANAGFDWLICDNAVVLLGTPDPSGGVFVYNWSPIASPWQNGTNENSAQPEVLIATSLTFSVTVTDPVTGCSDTDNVMVTVDNMPSIADAPDETICAGSSVMIGSPALSGVTYTWTPATGLSCTNCAQPIASPAATTAYTLTAMFPGMCMIQPTDMVLVTVNDPGFTMTGINYCPSAGVVALGTDAPSGMTTYRWLPAMDVSSPSTQLTNTLNPPPSTSTVYTLQVTDANNCTATATVTITPFQTPPIAGSNQVMCLNETTVLGSASNPTGAGISYNWSPATSLSDPISINPTFTPTAAGTFTYTMSKTDTNIPCTSTATVTVTVVSFTLPALASPTVCENTSVQIGTTPVVGVTYIWEPTTGLSDPNIANPIATVGTETVSYSLTAIGLNSCLATADVVVGSTLPLHRWSWSPRLRSVWEQLMLCSTRR